MCGTPYTEFQGLPAEATAAIGYPPAAAFQQGAAPYQQQATAYALDPTQALGQMPPHQPTHAQPLDAGFDSLFRRPEGEINPHSRTQVMQPIDADYRTPPPDGSPFGAGSGPAAFAQPGDGYPPATGPDAPQDWDEDEPGVRKPVLWGTIGAVLAASAVILGLLYIGGRNTGAAAATGTGTSTSGASAAASQPGIGTVQLGTGAPIPSSAAASPSASASASASASKVAGSTGLPLQVGSTGTYVQYVQTRLKQLGYYHGQVTKQYDQATATAVSAFQAHAGVTADASGTVGRSTLTALIAAGTQPTLKIGSRSADVRRLQEALNTAESAGLAVSGRYDAATAAAVSAYQRQVGIAVTGSADAQTWGALQSGTVV